jgi:hypothetical protein
VAVPVSPPVAVPVAVSPETAIVVPVSEGELSDDEPMSAGAKPTPVAVINATAPTSAPIRAVRFIQTFMSSPVPFNP